MMSRLSEALTIFEGQVHQLMDEKEEWVKFNDTPLLQFKSSLLEALDKCLLCGKPRSGDESPRSERKGSPRRGALVSPLPRHPVNEDHAAFVNMVNTNSCYYAIPTVAYHDSTPSPQAQAWGTGVGASRTAPKRIRWSSPTQKKPAEPPSDLSVSVVGKTALRDPIHEPPPKKAPLSRSESRGWDVDAMSVDLPRSAGGVGPDAGVETGDIGNGSGREPDGVRASGEGTGTMGAALGDRSASQAEIVGKQSEAVVEKTSERVRSTVTDQDRDASEATQKFDPPHRSETLEASPQRLRSVKDDQLPGEMQRDLPAASTVNSGGGRGDNKRLPSQETRNIAPREIDGQYGPSTPPPIPRRSSGSGSRFANRANGELSGSKGRDVNLIFSGNGSDAPRASHHFEVENRRRDEDSTGGPRSQRRRSSSLIRSSTPPIKKPDRALEAQVPPRQCITPSPKKPQESLEDGVHEEPFLPALVPKKAF
eukprot:Rmarinus@m.13676